MYDPSQLYQPQGNPYLQQQGQQMADTISQNYLRNVAPQTRSSANLVGGMGGSRQGVLEANQQRDMQTQIGNSLTNLYSTGYGQDQQHQLGLQGQQMQYDLGLRGQDLNAWNASNNWERQNRMDDLGLQQHQMGLNQAALGYGQQIQDQAFNNYSRFNQEANALGQGGGTQTTSGGRSDPLMGAAALAQLGGNMWSKYRQNQPATSANAPIGSTM